MYDLNRFFHKAWGLKFIVYGENWLGQKKVTRP